MLSKAHRFQGPNSLKYVYQKGTSVRGPFFAIKYAPNPRIRQYRFAVVVSRKVHKSAVIRNRLRRRLYEAVRKMDPEINSAYDIVLTVFNDALIDETPASLSKHLKKQLSAAGVLNRPNNE